MYISTSLWFRALGKCPFLKVDHLELRKRELVARPLSASLYTPPSSWNVEIRLNSYSSCFYMLEVFPSQFYPKEFFGDGMILTYVDWYPLLEMDDITHLF